MAAARPQRPTARLAQKCVALLLAALFLLSALMTGTLAWQGFNQHKTNGASSLFRWEDAGDPQTANLTLTKTVRNADDSALTDAQKNASFTFTVTFFAVNDGRVDVDTASVFSYSIDGVTDHEILSGGKIHLKHGERAVLQNIPLWTLYEITEAPAAGYVTQSTNHQGHMQAGGIVVRFVNTHTPASETGKLKITKIVTGKTPDPQEAFEFTITLGGAAETIYLAHNQSKTYENIPLGTAYTVAEKAYATDGYITSPSDGYTGQIAVNRAEITLPFVNTYNNASGEPGSLRITKTVTGPGAAIDKRFTFVVTFSGLPEEAITILQNGEVKRLSAARNQLSFALAHNESMLVQNLPAAVRYTVEETRDDSYRAVVKINKSDALNVNRALGAIAPETTADIEFINTHSKTNDINFAVLTVGKTVEGNPPAKDKGLQFNFVLEVEGEEPAPFKIEAGGTKKFTVPVGVPYLIREVDLPEGYSLVGTKNGSGTTTDALAVNFTNRYGKVYIPVSGQKTWDMTGAPKGTQPPKGITVYLMDGDKVVQTQQVARGTDGTWHYTFTAPKYRTDNETVIVYTVKEEPVDGYRAETSGLNLKNIWTGEEYTYISVEKTWVDDGNHPRSVTVQLYKDGAAYGAPVTLNEQSGWRHVWTRLVKGPVYTADEINVPNGYAKTVSGDAVNGFVITNTKGNQPKKAKVSVTKVWKDGNSPNRPNSITVQLYRDGAAHGGAVTLSAANSWKYTWANLENGPVWKVDEPNVPAEYAKTVAGDAKTGFVITNAAPPQGKVRVSGVKTWSHGSNAPSKRPKSITVQVKANGVMVAQRQVTEADRWCYAFVLDKYDAQGKKITYTVDEARINDYTKKVDGYNLYNKYKPGANTGEPNGAADPTNPGGTEGPNTGDESNMTLWVTLMCASFASLLVLAWFGYRSRRKERYVPQH